jgi:hypothetical protein
MMTRIRRSWLRSVLDHELCAFEVLFVVDLGAHQILIAHRVDQQHDAIFFHRRVILVDDLVEGEAVLKAGTAAALDENAQLQLRVALLFDQGLDLHRCCVGEEQRGRHFDSSVHCGSPRYLGQL